MPNLRLPRPTASCLLAAWMIAGTPLRAADDTFEVKPLTAQQAEEYKLDTKFYKKGTLVQNILIATSEKVPDVVHREAAYLFNQVMSDIKPEIAQRIRDKKVLCVLVGQAELVSDMPQYASDKKGTELDFYNWRNRGSLSSPNDRLTVLFAEEDVMEYEGGMQLESILIHEFGHVIDAAGLDKELRERLKKAFKHAKETGIYNDGYAAQKFRRVTSKTPVSLLDALVKSFPAQGREFLRQCLDGGDILVNGMPSRSDVKVTGDDKVLIVFGGPKQCYAGLNPAEYWAEGVQDWYDTNRTMDHDHNHIHTREPFKAYDPELAKLIADVLGDNAWRFVSPRLRAGTGHLTGYDPATAPTVAKLDHIECAAQDYYDEYWKDYWQRLHAKYPAIVVEDNAPPLVRLAAGEVQRYAYLRTGRDLAITGKQPELGPAIVFALDKALEREAYRLQTVTKDGQTVLHITGGSDVGVLYGAYRYAELLGVRFYMHGDVIPDERLKELPVVNDTGKPLFETRGLQPFHDFSEGPDWWNRDDYLAYVAQLAKLRMNFIGLHCYPEGIVGPEPLVWIGTTDDIGENGTVKSSYPAEWATTERHGMWGYASMNTGDYSGGASLLFPTDNYGPDVLAGMMPRPKTPEQCNELFNRVGQQMREVFAEAKALGVKTCIGTETPLTIPRLVRDRTTDVRALYTGMFKRIAMACPVDYYWLWTPEGWTWSGNGPKQFDAVKRDIQAALGALEDLGNPFTLATSGWVLGPAHDRAALDELLPKTSPMSCINRHIGHEGIEPAFANITSRPKWAIPWLENDANLVGPQPWAARMRYDAVDARRFGCTGLLGIHWRTKALEMSAAALAAAAWDQSWVPADFDTKPVKPSKSTEGAAGSNSVGSTAPAPRDRAMPVEDFYIDYARANFGESVAVPLGKLLASLDGLHMPEISGWNGGLGVLGPNKETWGTVKPKYDFVDKFAAFREQIKGAGNLERFDYWLNTYRAVATMAETTCIRSQLDKAMADKTYDAALTTRIDLARAWTRLLTLQTAIVRSPGELGTIANLEPHTRRELKFIEIHDAALTKALGKPLPPEAQPGKDYTGPPQIIVPTARGLLRKGEELKLTAIILDRELPKSASLHFRTMAHGEWHEQPLTHIGRAVYSATLPPAKEPIEYYITAETTGGKKLSWPVTAPEICHTLVVAE